MRKDTQRFFGLADPVFTRLPKVPYLDPSRNQAMVHLRALVARRGFAVLTAPPGCGKTALLHYLATELDDTRHRFFYLPFPFLEKGQMLSFLNARMGLTPRHGLAMTLRAVQKHLEELQPVNPVLVVDEAECLELSAAHLLRLVAHDRSDTAHHCTLILAGADRLVDHHLRLQVNEPLRQRITLYLRLHPMDQPHTAAYLAHHLKQAGGSGELFEPPALHLIHELSNGVPRVVNTLAETALDIAATAQRRAVVLDHVHEAAALALPPTLQELCP